MDVSHNLVTISNDGRVCYWSLENLNKPYDSQELIIKHATNRSVYASCIDFQAAKNDQRLAVVGTEDGLAHSLNASKYLSDWFISIINVIFNADLKFFKSILGR